jgi:hypothetical protein
MDTLNTWLTDRALTQEAAALLLGVPVRRLRSWIYEGKRPRTLEEMARIEAATGRQVRVLDWLQP